MAPQTTGHPASLPAAPPEARSDQQVQALDQNGDSTDAQARDSSSEKAAPPSAMQLKIMELLEQQAEQLEQSEPSDEAAD